MFDLQIQRFNIFAYYDAMQIFDKEGSAWQGYANTIIQTPYYRADRAPPPFPEPDNLSLREMYACINGPEGMLDVWDPSPHHKLWKETTLTTFGHGVLGPSLSGLLVRRHVVGTWWGLRHSLHGIPKKIH